MADKEYRSNYIHSKDSDSSADISFDLVDKPTVKRLQEAGEVTVPEKKVKIPEDKKWNTKQLGSKLLQGIQNGDSIDTISKSLMTVIGNNAVSAMRNARTMFTSAENNGRLDSYKALEEQGVVQKKVWIATPDDRTRESHLELDGEEVDINEPFSNGLMFPGDGQGEPTEVWNCRCTMRDHIVGFKKDDGSIAYIDYGRDETIHSRQIEEEKKIRKEKKDGKDSKREDRKR